MKRPMGLFVILVFTVSILYPGKAYAGRKTILDFLEGRYTTKVYVSDVVNSSEVNKVDAAGLKKSIEDALASRRSHGFEIVSERESAEIIIDTNVMEYMWTEEDPVDMIFSPIAAAADAAKADNYARMQADFTVKRARDGRKLWEDTVQSTITDDKMSEEQSYSRSNERIVKVFLKKLFKKPRRR